MIAGCPVYNRGWILDEWFEALETKVRPGGYFFVYTPSEDNTLEVLHKWRANLGSKTVRWATYEDGVHGKDRDWTNSDRIETLATMRNLLLDEAARQREPLLSVDSDVILMGNAFLQHWSSYDIVGPTVALATDRTVINGFSHRRPDGWTVRAKPGHHGTVDVLCAVQGIHEKAVPHLRYSYHPRGEDFGFAESAREHGIGMTICPEMTAHHMTQGRPPIYPAIEPMETLHAAAMRP